MVSQSVFIRGIRGRYCRVDFESTRQLHVLLARTLAMALARIAAHGVAIRFYPFLSVFIRGIRKIRVPCYSFYPCYDFEKRSFNLVLM
jgi:hypothetical protein